MPKIYEYLGFIFFFYSEEHLPLHVHVSFAEYESKIELEYSDRILKKINFKKVHGQKPIPSEKRKDIEQFINQYHLGIVEKWTTYFVFNQKPKNDKITKKI
jgi:hypothetical protein